MEVGGEREKSPKQTLRLYDEAQSHNPELRAWADTKKQMLTSCTTKENIKSEFTCILDYNYFSHLCNSSRVYHYIFKLQNIKNTYTETLLSLREEAQIPK